jgi:hypothetical protein
VKDRTISTLANKGISHHGCCRQENMIKRGWIKSGASVINIQKNEFMIQTKNPIILKKLSTFGSLARFQKALLAAESSAFDS